MRRWFSILLLVLLPIQFSWAAAAAYCEHESGARADHFGHHEHDHQGSGVAPVTSLGDPSIDTTSETTSAPTVDASVARSIDPTGGASKGSAAGAALDLAHSHCHFHCPVAAAVSSASAMQGENSGRPPLYWTEAHLMAPAVPRPERPQWAGHA